MYVVLEMQIPTFSNLMFKQTQNRQQDVQAPQQFYQVKENYTAYLPQLFCACHALFCRFLPHGLYNQKTADILQV